MLFAYSNPSGIDRLLMSATNRGRRGRRGNAADVFRVQKRTEFIASHCSALVSVGSLFAILCPAGRVRKKTTPSIFVHILAGRANF